ncbi:MAG: cytochrome c, partial [Comamonas sp.]
VAPAPAPVYAQHANGERIYQNACAVCHEAGSGPTLFGAKPLLALNTNLHAATPDNLVQVILHGIQSPANEALGHMPAFKDSLDDAQILDLTAYLRERFAPEEKAWPHDTTAISKLRAAAATH